MQPTAIRVDGQLLARAKKIAQKYRFLIEKNEDGPGYTGSAVEMPTVYGLGNSADACVSDLVTNLSKAIAILLQKGRIPPRAEDLPLNEHVHIRLSAEEKLVIESEARRQGFKGISDYSRHVLLAKHRA